MATHELKTVAPHFAAIRSGAKTFELRRDDRGFAVGDVLVLREWVMEGHFYTGEQEQRRVTYKLEGGEFGLTPGYCALGLERIVETQALHEGLVVYVREDVADALHAALARTGQEP